MWVTQKLPTAKRFANRLSLKAGLYANPAGRGQFGHVVIEVEPLEKGTGFEFIDDTKGRGHSSRIHSISEKKVIEGAMNTGVLAGYPVVDVSVKLVDGSHHAVDSSEMAFSIAGSMAFKDAMKRATPALLEPIMNVEVIVPDEYLGKVIGDLNARLCADTRNRNTGKNLVSRSFGLMYRSQKCSDTSKPLGHSHRVELPTLWSFAHYNEVPTSVMEDLISAANGNA